MGTRSSRRDAPKKPTVPTASQKNFDRETQPNNSHYNALNQVVNAHLSRLVHTRVAHPNPSRSTVDIHGNALQLAVKHHLDAATRNQPDCPHAYQLIYIF